MKPAPNISRKGRHFFFGDYLFVPGSLPDDGKVPAGTVLTVTLVDFGLAWAYANGVGAPHDIARAMGWFELASAAGHLGARHWLGGLLIDLLGSLSRQAREMSPLAKPSVMSRPSKLRQRSAARDASPPTGS